MKQHLMQIAVLMTYVIVNNAAGPECRQVGLKPVSFPPEYLIGNWTVAYCIESPLCSQALNCAKYQYRKNEYNTIILRASGYSQISGKTIESEAEVIFPGPKGQFIVQDLYDIKLLDFLMLHAEKHFCVLYACLVDQEGDRIPAAWIGIKDDPENHLDGPELFRAAAILRRNGFSFSDFQRPPYYNCNNTNQISANLQEDLNSFT